jgi:hypothetical protein
VAPVYDFGPDGTQFGTPATLQIAFAGNVPEGKKVVLAIEEGGAWQEIPGSSLAGGVVTGPVAHFSRFSLILVDGEIVAVSECAEIADSFQPCGGDVVGRWAFADFCFQNTAIGSDPFEGRCPGARLDASFEVEGTVEFTADQMTTQFTEQTQTVSIHVPTSCLGGAACEQAFDDFSCQNTADACDCTKSETEEPDPPETQGYRVEGNEIVFLNEDGSEDERVRFCVQGDKATVETISTNGDGQEIRIYYVVERQ